MLKRWNWGHSIAVVYTAFALGTVGLLAFATRQSEELVSPDYYTQALNYDQVIDATRNARELGAAFGSRISADGRTLVLSFPAGEQSDAGTITFYRPSDSRADRQVAIAVGEDGTQQVPLAGLASGAWRLRVDWIAGARPYHFERTLDVP
jgi:nitrogen fixation protein FixH